MSPAGILYVASGPTVSTGMDFGESHRHRFVAVFFFSHDLRNAIGGKSGTTKIFFFSTHNPETRDLSFDLVDGDDTCATISVEKL